MESEFTLEDQIDTICDRFEEAWKSEQQPKVEEFWEPLAGDTTNRLLEELVSLDLDYRSKNGQEISLEIYVQKFPDHEITVRSILGEKGCSESPTKMGVERQSTMAGGSQPRDLTRQNATVPLLKQVGPYRLLKKIGSGGMGMVYLAEQKEPVRRRVAIKLMRTELDTPELLARFEIEIQAVSMMNHPNIARVLDIGKTETGIPYLAIEYVEGFSLTKYCDHRQLSIGERLELFGQLCTAIGHAHRKGVLHRDLKPSNILVSEAGGKRRVKVIDFGLARAVNPQNRLAENTLVTMPGNALGTLEYMSPEQAEMNELGLDTRTDVYSLGAILYELLTGTTPLTRDRAKNEGLHRIMIQVVEGEFEKPSVRLLKQGGSMPQVAANRQSTPQRLPGILRKELDWICAKALQKNRSHRYEGVAFLLKDIQNYLSGDVVVARPPTLSYRLGKSLWKNRTIFTASLLLLIILLGGWWTTRANLEKTRQQEQKAKQAQRYSKRMENLAREETRSARKAEKVAVESEADAKENLLIAEKNSYVADMLVVQNDWENKKDIKRISSLLDKYRLRPDLAGFVWNYWSHQTSRLTQCRMQHVRTGDDQGPTRDWGWRGEGNVAICADFSPDGRQVVSIANGDMIRIWDVARGTELRRIKSPEPLEMFDTVQFSPDGRKLLCTHDRTAFVLDAETGKLVVEIRRRGAAFYGAAFSTDQKEIITARSDLTVDFWDAVTGKKLRSAEGMLPNNIGLRTTAFMRSIQNAIKNSSPENQRLRFWDIQKESWIPLPARHIELKIESKIMASRNGYYLVLSSKNGGLIQLMPNGSKRVFWCPFGSSISTCAIDSSGKYIAAGSYQGKISLWHVDRPNEPMLIRETARLIKSLDFSPDSTRLLSFDSGGDLRVLNLGAKKFPEVISSFPVKNSKLSNNRTLGIVYGEGKIQVFQPGKNKQVQGFDYPGSNVDSVAIADSGQHVLVAHWDGTVRMLNANSGKEIWNWKGSLRQSFSPGVSFNSSEEHVLIGDGKQIVILSAKDGSVVHSWQAHERNVTGLAFHPDGKRVASGAYDGIVRFWDATNARQIWSKPGRSNVTNRLAFSLDGHTLATACGPVRVLETETGRQTCKIDTLAYYVKVNRDGSRIATIEYTGEIKIWEGENGKELLTLKTPRKTTPRWIAFGHDDGRRFMARDGSALILWDVLAGTQGPGKSK